MKLHYDVDMNDITVELNDSDRDPESFLIELSVGIAALIIRAMLDTIPNPEQHQMFEKLLIEQVEENLGDWHYGAFAL